jgi:hypothetical protein
MFVLVLT